MDQMSFGDGEYASKRKRTRRETFLAEMERVIPWTILLNLIEPVYPKAGNGRRPYRSAQTPILKRGAGDRQMVCRASLIELARHRQAGARC